MRFLLVIMVLLSTTLLGADRVRIGVASTSVMRGSNLWVTCRVPVHVENRKLTIAMELHRSTDYQIAGTAAPQMYRFLLQEIPCVAESAVYCLLKTTTDSFIDSRPLTVMGCGAE